MRIIGCDLHARQQTLAMLDTATGEVAAAHAVRPGPELRQFYRRKLVRKGLGKARVAAARKLGFGCGSCCGTRLITKSSVVVDRCSTEAVLPMRECLDRVMVRRVTVRLIRRPASLRGDRITHHGRSWPKRCLVGRTESMKRKRPELVGVTQVKHAATETRLACHGGGVLLRRKKKNEIS
jgi:hypothetical protein